jgi:hypothetical protein
MEIDADWIVPFSYPLPYFKRNTNAIQILSNMNAKRMLLGYE